MNKLILVRWYKKYADGWKPKDKSEYEYTSFGVMDTDEQIEEYLRENVCDCEKGEHYRGIFWEKIEDTLN